MEPYDTFGHHTSMNEFGAVAASNDNEFFQGSWANLTEADFQSIDRLAVFAFDTLINCSFWPDTR